MSTLENPKKRLLDRSDIVVGREFTLSQIVSVETERGTYNLRVGDVIKIERRGYDFFEISVNGHNTGIDAIRVALDEIPNFVIQQE